MINDIERENANDLIESFAQIALDGEYSGMELRAALFALLVRSAWGEMSLDNCLRTIEIAWLHLEIELDE